MKELNIKLRKELKQMSVSQLERYYYKICDYERIVRTILILK